jgi:hypothetical protein
MCVSLMPIWIGNGPAKKQPFQIFYWDMFLEQVSHHKRANVEQHNCNWYKIVELWAPLRSVYTTKFENMC